MNLRHLRSFAAVAEDLHFGRAAKKLGISQPPLTQHIQALETELGMRLFDRDRRSVNLTGAGLLLYREARALLDHADRVRRILGAHRSGRAGTLSISCVPSAMFRALPPILAKFRQNFPNVDVVLREAHTATIIEQVVDGLADVGLVWAGRPAAPLNAQVVWRDTFVAALPEALPLGKQTQVSLVDLAAESLIILPRRINPRHYDTVIAAFTNSNLTPRIEYEPTSVISQISFVANSFGIGILPAMAADIPIDRVVYRPIQPALPPVELSLIWHDRSSEGPVTLLRQVAGRL